MRTARLLLRPLRVSDIDDFAVMCADADVMRYLGTGPLHREDAWRQLAFFLGHWGTSRLRQRMGRRGTRVECVRRPRGTALPRGLAVSRGRLGSRPSLLGPWIRTRGRASGAWGGIRQPGLVARVQLHRPRKLTFHSISRAAWRTFPPRDRAKRSSGEGVSPGTTSISIGPSRS